MSISSTLAAQSYTATKPITAPKPGKSDGVLVDAVTDFAATMQKSEALAMQTMTSGADPHALVEAIAQTELAVETAVTIRNKVIEAYQEVLRMPV